MATEAAVAAWEVDEWELCNDDGFVYKRRKRKRQHEDDSIPSGSAATAASDQEAELRQRRRDQKKQTLMKLRDQYQREIDHWEQLSNTLRGMEESTNKFHQHHHESSSVVPQQIEKSVCEPSIDELLLQTEAQEAIIQDVSNLCDTAEALCKAEEEGLKSSLFDLPVWATPDALIDSLSDPDYCNNEDNAQNT